MEERKEVSEAESVWPFPELPEDAPKTPLKMITLEECESIFSEMYLQGLKEYYEWSDEETERVKQLAIDVGIWKAESGE